MFPAFERYGTFTDLQALTAFSSRPLRKSMRVNTLKCSVDFFKRWAQDRSWILEPIPWCPEGFFIDREDREEALGKDLLHLLGYTYMQEAASMLPVELLDPQPGETILDMSAAPGSKTTQIAAKMQGSGVIVANDMQEHRLWTLKTALHRSGVWNVIVTKKVGQWFGKHMTERFDRVLCDAPCTAQGTVRKDADALKYSSPDAIGKMAKLQRELLEAAVHACKVGGRIVYSTCTLTPEENEELVLGILQKFPGQLEAVDPLDSDFGLRIWDFGEAIHDSEIVQRKFRIPNSELRSPFLRLWPQTYDTEGFFCAVLHKTAPTRAPEKFDRAFFQEKPLERSIIHRVADQLSSEYGTSFLQEGETLFALNDQILLSTKDIADFHLPVQDYALGLPFVKGLKDHTVRVTHEIATLRGNMATDHVLDLPVDTVEQLLSGLDSSTPSGASGDFLLRWKGLIIGRGLAINGVLKNRLPRWILQVKAN